MKAIIKSLLFFIVSISALAYVFGYVVGPGLLGVRQIAFGPYQGYSDKILNPGYHWSVPLYSKVHIVPAAVQVFDLTRNDDILTRVGSAVEVQTTDGSSVLADLTILWRFFPNKSEQHGGPVQLVNQLGVSYSSWQNTIIRVAVDNFRRELGRLSTVDFYNPTLREAQIAKALTAMNDALAEFGIKIEAVLLRRYTYSEERIDSAIYQKNLQDQEERQNAAASKLAAARAQLEQSAAELDAKIQTLKIEGNNQALVIKSAGDLYATEQKAKADLLVAKAESDVQRRKAELLSSAPGSDSYVAKEMSGLVSSLQGGIISDIDPYDLNAWTRKFGVGAERDGGK